VIGKNTAVTLKSGSTLGDLLNKLEEKFGSAYKKITGERLELRESMTYRTAS